MMMSDTPAAIQAVTNNSTSSNQGTPTNSNVDNGQSLINKLNLRYYF